MTSINQRLCSLSVWEHSVCPPKKIPFLGLLKHSSGSILLSPSDERNQESLFRLKVGQGCTLEIQGNDRASLAKGRGGFLFHLHAFKIHRALVWIVSLTLPTSNFRGIDRKPNMSEDVENCHSWIIGCQQRTKNTPKTTYWDSYLARSLLSWAQSRALQTGWRLKREKQLSAEPVTDQNAR